MTFYDENDLAQTRFFEELQKTNRIVEQLKTSESGGGASGPATQIEETSGPTTLDIGAIADDAVLARIGTEIVGFNGGWIPTGETWTYATSTTVTIAGDKRNKYSKGMKVKLTQTTVRQYYITNVTYSAPNTTLTLNAGTDFMVANAAITSPFYSMVANPAGFPHVFSYTPTVTYAGGTTNPTSMAVSFEFSIVGNQVLVIGTCTLTRGSGDRTYTFFTKPIPSQKFGSGSFTCTFVSGGETLGRGVRRHANGIACVHGTMTSDGFGWLTATYFI